MKKIRLKWLLLAMLCLPLLTMPIMNCSQGAGQNCELDADCPNVDDVCINGECEANENCSIASCEQNSDCAIFGLSNCSDNCCVP